jgi:hypothetical protein
MQTIRNVGTGVLGWPPVPEHAQNSGGQSGLRKLFMCVGSIMLLAAGYSPLGLLGVEAPIKVDGYGLLYESGAIPCWLC